MSLIGESRHGGEIEIEVIGLIIVDSLSVNKCRERRGSELRQRDLVRASPLEILCIGISSA